MVEFLGYLGFFLFGVSALVVCIVKLLDVMGELDDEDFGETYPAADEDWGGEHLDMPDGSTLRFDSDGRLMQTRP